MAWRHYTPEGRLKDRGGLYPPQGLIASAKKTVDVAVGAGNQGPVTFDSVLADPFLGFVSTSRFQPKTPGWYLITSKLQFSATGSGNFIEMYLARNSTGTGDLSNAKLIGGGLGVARTDGWNTITAEGLAHLNGTGDYVEVYYNSGAASGNMRGVSQHQSFFNAQLIGSSVGVIPEPWHLVGSGGSEPAFQNGWANESTAYTQCRFFKDPHGIVHLSGHASGTSASGSTAFTLPAGYRPGAAILFLSKYYLGAASSFSVGELAVQANGAVNLTKVDETAALTARWYVLDGITFRAEQ